MKTVIRVYAYLLNHYPTFSSHLPMHLPIDEDKSNRLMQQIEGRLVEAKNLIKQMEVDLRSQDGTFTFAYNNIHMLTLIL
jgi:hypothetical protein